MMEKLKILLGIKPPIDFKELMEQGGQIIDVRSPGEFGRGHISGSKNIPLAKLESRATSLGKNNKPIITCCASGMRSARARKILQAKGFDKVYNGGGWRELDKKVKS